MGTRGLEVNDTVRILRYPEDSINGYGRIAGILKRREKRYWVVNGNMPFCGTISDYFDATELRLCPEKTSGCCPTCGKRNNG